VSGIFSSLHSSASALNVFSQALGAEQQNVSNSATQGYAAKRVRITDPGVGGTTASDTVQITSASDRFADAIVRNASGDLVAPPPVSHNFFPG
jgi:flagellar hook-associated protein FlgK